MRYRLRHKRLWRADGVVQPGDLVEPTEAELRAFPDRFEPLDEPTMSEAEPPQHVPPGPTRRRR